MAREQKIKKFALLTASSSWGPSALQYHMIRSNMNGKGSSRACQAVRIISKARDRKWTVSSLKGRGRVCLVVYAELLQHKLLCRDEKEQMQIGHVCVGVSCFFLILLVLIVFILWFFQNLKGADANGPFCLVLIVITTTRKHCYAKSSELSHLVL